MTSTGSFLAAPKAKSMNKLYSGDILDVLQPDVQAGPEGASQGGHIATIGLRLDNDRAAMTMDGRACLKDCAERNR